MSLNIRKMILFDSSFQIYLSDKNDCETFNDSVTWCKENCTMQFLIVGKYPRYTHSLNMELNYFSPAKYEIDDERKYTACQYKDEIGLIISFQSEEDAVAYKLKWMDNK